MLQNYSAQNMSGGSMAAPSDPYTNYYGSNAYSYQFGVGDGTWSNGGDPVTFLSGYPATPQIAHDTGKFLFYPGTPTIFSMSNFQCSFHSELRKERIYYFVTNHYP